MRYAIGTTTHTEYPVEATLDALERALGWTRGALLERVASIGAPAVRTLVDEVGPTLAPEAAAGLRESLDALASKTLSPRLVAKEERPAGSQGGCR
jgi:hypothetical protein